MGRVEVKAGKAGGPLVQNPGALRKAWSENAYQPETAQIFDGPPGDVEGFGRF